MLRSILTVPSCVFAVSLLVLLYRAHLALGVGMLGLVVLVGLARGARRSGADAEQRESSCSAPNLSDRDDPRREPSVMA